MSREQLMGAPRATKVPPKVEVPVLGVSNRKPPRGFQRLLDEFNRSSGESLFVYWNPRAVPKPSSTVSLDGHYANQGWDGRWELYRPVSERMSVKMLVMIQPVVVPGHGPAVKLWTIQDDPKPVKLQHPSGAEQIVQVGTPRNPDERDIRKLRLCDVYRDKPGAVVSEILDKHNESIESEQDKELDDLAHALTSYYWSKGSGQFAVNWDCNRNSDNPQERIADNG